MALIILPILFAIWAFFFLPYAEKIPIWLKWKNPKRARWMLIILFSILPFGDEIVGRAQFAYECERGNLSYVNPKIKFTSRAKYMNKQDDQSFLKYKMIPIEKMTSRIIDIDTGDIILESSRFYTYGGIILRSGLNMGNFSVCPNPINQVDIKNYGFKIRKNNGELIFIKDKEEK